jgi:hypothetical protein
MNGTKIRVLKEVLQFTLLSPSFRVRIQHKILLSFGRGEPLFTISTGPGVTAIFNNLDK